MKATRAGLSCTRCAIALRQAQADAAERQAQLALQAEQHGAPSSAICSPSASGAVRAAAAGAQGAWLDASAPQPHPRQRELDEQRAMREALSDEVDVETLLLTDEG